nr:Forms the bulk of type IV secretion complex that spans outer membrane and periplasm (VirB9) [Escherichia coli]
MALEVGRNSPYDYRIKALFITLLMWSKLTLSPVWLPTLLSRLTKPISLMLLAILKAGRLRTK